MNKIITSIKKELNIEHSEKITIQYNDTKKDIVINIKENQEVVIDVIKENTKDTITYNLGKNASLTVNKLVIDNSDDVKVNLEEGSHIVYNYSTINYKENVYKIEMIHKGKNSFSHVINHGVNMKKNKLEFLVNGSILAKSINCICNQDNKIISMQDNNATIKPNLMIDNNQIQANHSAYIGKFKEEEIFYLMSRGINKKECNKLLLRAFLLGHIQLEEGKFLNIINRMGGE